MHRFAVLLLAATAAVGACNSSDDADTAISSATADGDAVAVGVAPLPGGGVGSIGDAMEMAASTPGEAADAACIIDRRTLQLAVETYELLNGTMPTTQQELIDAQMIRELSVRYELDADATVIPSPNSPCA